MKKVILVALLIMIGFALISAQTQEQKGIKITIETNRHNVAYKIATTIYHDEEFRQIFFSETDREKVRNFLIKKGAEKAERIKQNLSNISKQDSLIAFAVGIDLSDENALERIQTMHLVIDQLAEQKAQEKVKDLLGNIVDHLDSEDPEDVDAFRENPQYFFMKLFREKYVKKD